MTGDVFADLAARLGPGFECHAPDLPGHGSNQTSRLGLDACCDLVDTLVHDLDRPVLVGWSMGAGAAWRYVRTRGTSALAGLITIDMSPRIMPDDGWDKGMKAPGAGAILAATARIRSDWPRVAGCVSRNMFAARSAPVLSAEEVRLRLLAQSPKHLSRAWEDLVTLDERQTIPQIDIPYLVCSGRQSRLYSDATAQWICSQARDARLHQFEGSGHSPHLEEPDLFCQVLRNFLRDRSGHALQEGRRT